MRTHTARAGLLALILLLGARVGGAQQSPDSTKTVLARQILEVMGSADQAILAMERTIAVQRQTTPDVPDRFWDRFLELARERKAELVDLLVPVYTEAFTAQDLQGLLVFYRSPIGRRYIQASPQLIQASMQVGERWGITLGQQVAQEMEADDGS